jgi:DNA-directed RNA polymerase subunit RPC12/RpoP
MSDTKTESQLIRESYDEECPDCSYPIPGNVTEGDECEYCGHVFCLPHPND